MAPRRFERPRRGSLADRSVCRARHWSANAGRCNPPPDEPSLLPPLVRPAAALRPAAVPLPGAGAGVTPPGGNVAIGGCTPPGTPASGRRAATSPIGGCTPPGRVGMTPVGGRPGSVGISAAGRQRPDRRLHASGERRHDTGGWPSGKRRHQPAGRQRCDRRLRPRAREGRSAEIREEVSDGRSVCCPAAADWAAGCWAGSSSHASGFACRSGRACCRSSRTACACRRCRWKPRVRSRYAAGGRAEPPSCRPSGCPSPISRPNDPWSVRDSQTDFDASRVLPR